MSGSSQNSFIHFVNKVTIRTYLVTVVGSDLSAMQPAWTYWLSILYMFKTFGPVEVILQSPANEIRFIPDGGPGPANVEDRGSK